ncbi:hypothetical protein KKE26_04900 [bacterium]|nr:hypothetical protein [bacterium]MBU1752896.1 hypothetical protein [bacterium]
MKNELMGSKIAKYFSKFFYDLGMMLIGAAILGKIFGKELTGEVIIAVILVSGYFIIAGAVISIFIKVEDK